MRVLYLQYTNPAGYPPLEHSSRILADAGWDVLFLGAMVRGTDMLQFPPHPRIRVRHIPFCLPGWRQKLHYARFCLWSLWWALRWQPDWVYASDMLSCLPGLLLRTLTRARLLYHEHDSPVEASHQSAFLRLSFWARSACANHAELCILPNRRRAESFAALAGHSKRVEVIWNCPAQDEVTPPRAPSAGEEIKLLYHGSIVPDRLPLTVIDALSQTPAAVSLTVVGYETAGSAGYLDTMRKHADSLGINGRLHLVGTIASRPDLMAICRGCDIGLSLLPMESTDDNLQAMAGASNKPFDYLASGLPMLVSDLPDWREMFVEPGYALACIPQDRDSIAAAIRRFCDNRDGMRAMGEQGRQRILAEWNYERQFQPIVQLMSTLE